MKIFSPESFSLYNTNPAYLFICHFLVYGIEVPGAQLLCQAHQLLLSKAKLLQYMLLTAWVHLRLQHMCMGLKKIRGNERILYPSVNISSEY